MGKKIKRYKKSMYTTKYGQTCSVFKDSRTVHALAMMIIELSKKGHTLEMILSNLDIPNSLWMKNANKHKILKNAVSDALVFHKAFGQMKLKKMAEGKTTHSPQMAKVWLSSFYDINEVYKEPEGKKPESGYVVVTQQAAPEEEPNDNSNTG